MDEFEIGFNDVEAVETPEDDFDEGYQGRVEEPRSQEEGAYEPEHKPESKPDHPVDRQERPRTEYQTPETEAEPELPEEVKAYYEDWPEARAALDHELQKRLGGVGEALAISQWERAVVAGCYNKDGKYLEGVPEYYRIAAPGNKEYWSWYESKGYGACDPPTAIARLREWQKTHKESTGDGFAEGFKEK